MFKKLEFDVFLSHSAEDKGAVRPLAERLRQGGLRAWFDERVLKRGASVPANTQEGLEHSRVPVLCMWRRAVGSDLAQFQNHTFRLREPLNQERGFVPLRLEDTPLKGSLAKIGYMNCPPPDEIPGCFNVDRFSHCC